jgi:hydrogenase maturation protease
VTNSPPSNSIRGNSPLINSANILVAGIGNIFLGDDAFGSEVAQRLLHLPQPDGVRIIDFGIRGLDLMYALSDGCDVAILIDAVPRGDTPGTLFLIEPQIDEGDAAASPPMLDAHAMDPLKVLRCAASMGTLPAQIFIVGCQPSPLPQDEEMQMEMSAPVRGAIDEAVSMVQQIVARVLADRSDKLKPAHSQELSC